MLFTFVAARRNDRRYDSAVSRAERKSARAPLPCRQVCSCPSRFEFLGDAYEARNDSYKARGDGAESPGDPPASSRDWHESRDDSAASLGDEPESPGDWPGSDCDGAESLDDLPASQGDRDQSSGDWHQSRRDSYASVHALYEAKRASYKSAHAAGANTRDEASAASRDDPKRARDDWCSGGDLNPHAFRHTPLKRTCLPFHHPSE